MTSASDQDARVALLKAAELVGVLEVLRGAGVECVAFKGPTLALAAYGDLAARRYNDLDILVLPPDFDGARAALREDGYRLADFAGDSSLARIRRSEKDVTLRHPERVLPVELHWRLFSPILAVDLDEAGMWRRRTSLAVAGFPIPVFANADLVLYLAIHGGKHAWLRPEWLRAFTGLVRRTPDLDVSTIRARAEASGTLGFLTVAFALAETEDGLPMPSALRDDAADPAVGRLVAELRDGRGKEARRAMKWRPVISAMRERRLDRVRYLWRSIIRPSRADYAWLRLPSWADPLYYVLRPFRLTHKYAHVGWRVISAAHSTD